MAKLRLLALGMTAVSVFGFTLAGGTARFAASGRAGTVQALGSSWR